VIDHTFCRAFLFFVKLDLNALTSYEQCPVGLASEPTRRFVLAIIDEWLRRSTIARTLTAACRRALLVLQACRAPAFHQLFASSPCK